MSLAEEMRDYVESVVSSYEMRLQNVADLFDTTSQLLGGSQGPFLDQKQASAKISVQIRDTLSQNEHLRRKDFDNMMQGLLATQEAGEKESRELLKIYLTEQKDLAQALRENLRKFRDSIAQGESQRAQEFQALIKEILAGQDKRKAEVTARLKEFQKEQREMAARLKELLTKGKELRIKDLKVMLNEFSHKHKRQAALQQEARRQDQINRRKEKEERGAMVKSLLEDFKNQRLNIPQKGGENS